MGLLIFDGYTEEATVKTKGYPDVLIRFRPATPAELFAYRNSLNDEVRFSLDATVKLLASKVQGWDLVEKAGDLRKILKDDAANALKEVPDSEEVAVPVREETLRIVPPRVLDALFDKVTGYSKGREEDGKN